MAAAELVDPQLRAGIRSARASAVRCVKAVVVAGSGAADGGGKTLALDKAVEEDPNLSLDKEFSRCTAELVEDDKPCLLLFRADGKENIESSRWLLVAWVPDAAPEADRATYVRSRGLLSRLVTQPYFLREFFANSRSDLKWAVANRAGSLAATAAAPVPSTKELAAVNDSRAPEGPVTRSSGVTGLLERFAQREEPCIRLQMIKDRAAGTTTLDGKPHDCKSVTHLLKAGLPQSVCFLATFSKEDLVFILWCPDVGSKRNPVRVQEEAGYAVMKSTVLSVVLEALPARPARVIQIDARESQDIHEALVKATEGFAPPPRTSGRSNQDATERSWPVPGAPADWPADWPPAALSASMPSTLALFQRPVPPWRGGSKAHTITGTDGGSHMQALRRHKTQKLGARDLSGH